MKCVLEKIVKVVVYTFLFLFYFSANVTDSGNWEEKNLRVI